MNQSITFEFNELIDPISVRPSVTLNLEIEYKKNLELKAIINTHEHGDHTGGNLALSKLTKVEILAHYGASGKIPGMTKSLKEGDLIKVGKEIELLVLDTGGIG